MARSVPIWALCGWALVAVRTPAASAQTTSLACDVPAQGTIETPAESDLFEFSAAEGEIVSVTVVADPSSSLIPFWGTLNNLGQPASNCGEFRSFEQRDCGPLSQSESPYRVQVEDAFLEATGAYTVHLQRLTASEACDEMPLACGVDAFDVIEAPVDNDLFRFCVTEGTTVAVAVAGDPLSNLVPAWVLLDGLGGRAANCSFFSSPPSQKDCGPLAESGNPYRVEVRDAFFAETGDYAVTVVPVSGSCVVCPQDVIFADGFESGDSAVWSAAVN